MNAGIHLTMSELEYHASPELSSTEARLILDSPAKYRWKKDHPPLIAASKKFDVGSAVHSLVLGTGYEAVMIPADLLSSNGAIGTAAAKAFVEQARAEGKIPLKEAEFEPIRLQAESVLANPSAAALFNQPGNREVSVFAKDPVTGVECRARFDFLPTQGERRVVAVDVKTTVDASPRKFERSIADYGYDTQRGFYLDVYGWATGPMPVGLEPEFVFVAVEKEPPYLTAVYQLTPQWAAMGHTKAAHARAVYAEAKASGVWAGYPTDINFVAPPQWALYQFEETYK